MPAKCWPVAAGRLQAASVVRPTGARTAAASLVPRTGADGLGGAGAAAPCPCRCSSPASSELSGLLFTYFLVQPKKSLRKEVGSRCV